MKYDKCGYIIGGMILGILYMKYENEICNYMKRMSYKMMI